MKRILVLTDFSAAADTAADYALSLAAKTGAEIVLYNAYFSPPLVAATVGASLYRDLHLIKKNSIIQLLSLAEKLKKKLPEKGLQAIPIYIQHGPGNIIGNIADLIDQQKIWIAVMGCSSTTGSFNKFIFGSNTHSVIDCATCPVLIIPEKAEAKIIRHIALASELKLAERRSFLFLSKFTAMLQANLVVIHVYSGKLSLKDKMEFYQHYQSIIKGHDHSAVSYMDASGEDIPATLQHFTDHEQIDIIAVVHKKRPFITSLFNGSITKALVDSQRVPLLVFPTAKTIRIKKK